MIVMKFGGSSLADAERIRDAVRIVMLNRARHPIVVVSALGGVTDALLKAAKLATEGKGREAAAYVADRHSSVIRDLGIPLTTVDPELSRLSSILAAVSMLNELTPKTLDEVASLGERMSSRIVAAYMRKEGAGAAAHDAYDIGMITDSRFGNADCLPESMRSIRAALSRQGETIPVVTGYIGKDREGSITTLGRGGSDYTASILGAAIGADEIQIWTDVNGIMTADPRVVKGALSIPKVSYSEASELAFLGAKVLHPKTILPAIEKRIPVRILNTFNPSHKGTVVLREIATKRRVASIACKKGIKSINIYNPNMFLAHGFMKGLFSVFDSFGISIDMIATSNVSVSVTLDEDRDLRGLVRELSSLAQVEIREGRAKISLVGKQVAFIPGLFGRMFSSLDDIRVEMISSSASETNQGFVVKGEDADKAVARLHREFFGR